jgi:uncharacterized membrane protein
MVSGHGAREQMREATIRANDLVPDWAAKRPGILQWQMPQSLKRTSSFFGHSREFPAPETGSRRVTVVDVLRGLVMVLMPLDHTREFFNNYAGNPLDPQHTTFSLYLTRWITHLCAPVFVFLAGTSIFLQQQRKTRRQLTQHLLMRGLWLIIVELTLVDLVMNFHWEWNVHILEVIWVIGASMMIMALLIHLDIRWNLLLGACLVGGHNLLDGVSVDKFGRFGWLWNLLHVPGLSSGASMTPPIILVAYPLLPWLGVMVLGYAFGTLLMQERDNRRRWELRAGLIMLVAFALLRWSNLYGDPVRWSSQATWWRTGMAFLNVQKYPPSFLFVLVTLGIAALIAAGIESAEKRNTWGWVRSVLQVYGRVPFFYFLLHIALIHLLALGLSAVRGGNWQWWVTDFPRGGVLTGRPPGYGYGLAVVWCVWIFVVVLCYPVCKWYAGVKRRSRNPVFSYL